MLGSGGALVLRPPVASSGWADAPAADVRAAAVWGSPRGDAAYPPRAREAVRAASGPRAPPRFSPGSRVGRATLRLHRSSAHAPRPRPLGLGACSTRAPTRERQPATSMARRPNTPRTAAPRWGSAGTTGTGNRRRQHPIHLTAYPSPPSLRTGGAGRLAGAGGGLAAAAVAAATGCLACRARGPGCNGRCRVLRRGWLEASPSTGRATPLPPPPYSHSSSCIM